MRILAFTAIALLVALAFVGSANETKRCPPLEITQDIPADSADDPPPRLADSPISATISGHVEESGGFSDLHIIRASSTEAGDWVTRRVATMRFKPRPMGCGPLAYEITVNVQRKDELGSQ